MKEIITVMAALTAMALIGAGIFGFVNDLTMWGAPIIAGMFTGAFTLAIAYNL